MMMRVKVLSPLVVLAAAVFAVTLSGCPPAQSAKAQEQFVKSVEWETLTPPNSYSSTYRTRTPEGWLVFAFGMSRPSVVFVPDPEHKWLAPQPESDKQ